MKQFLNKLEFNFILKDTYAIVKNLMLLSTLVSMFIMITEPNANISVNNILYGIGVPIFAINFTYTLFRMIYGCFASNLVKIIEFILSYVFCIPFVFIEKYLITRLFEIKINPNIVIWIIFVWFGALFILILIKELVSYLTSKYNKPMKAEIEYCLINSKNQNMATIKSKTDGTIETSKFDEGTYNLHHSIIRDSSYANYL